MDDQLAEPQTVAVEEGKVTLWGYRRDRLRTCLTWIAIVASAFFLRIVFHWRPCWYLKATHLPTSLRQAEMILLEDEYGQIWVHRVRLNTFSGTEVKVRKPRLWKLVFNPPRTVGYEMEAPGEEDSLLRFFVNKKLKFMWNWREERFELIRTLDEDLPGDPHTLTHLSFREAARRRVFFDPNVIDVPITPLIKVLLLQALHPFYVFQVFSCVLWYFDQYWQYATCIIIESVISLSLAVVETRRNERSLRNTVAAGGFALVQREGEFREMPAELLVPGDVVEVPRAGCDLLCDAVLLCGHAIVNESLLTGESVPVSKVPLPMGDEEGEGPARRQLDLKAQARHVLFSGTRVIQARNYEGERVRALVLRTGFATAKGQLVRAIMFPKPMRYRFDRDILHYLAVLCVFGAIGFVYTIAIMITYQKPGHLIARRALDLITVIVPPALPAAMSVGLVYSLRRLKSNRIFCIAPRTINASGGLDVFAFDKTGTLTEDGLDLRRVLHVEPGSGQLVEAVDARSLDPCQPLVSCMAAAHSLARIEGNLCGDPVDIKMFEAIGWRLEEPLAGGQDDDVDTVHQMVPREVTYQEMGLKRSIGLLREFPFSSSLQRMAVLGRVLGDSSFSVFVKGSPEVVSSLCRPETVPSDLDSRLAHYTQRGYRVLALAWRSMERLTVVRVHRVSREEVERDLNFVGLLVMENRLKAETKPTIAELKAANIRMVMVTGDNMLTALSVARECELISQEDQIVTVVTSFDEHKGRLELDFQVVDGNVNSSLSNNGDTVVDKLLPLKPSRVHLALSGRAWAEIRSHRAELVPRLAVLGTVFARFSPEQKAQLIEALQAVGHSVGMCGDGANDCGALKAAHAGISLSEAEASVASAFTSKRHDISCVPALISEGRCALVTSFGVFKYMAGYSLTQFVSVLILYYLKLNLADGQYLYIDLIIITSLSITFGYTRPAKRLHPRPPPDRLINAATVLSLVLLPALNLCFQLGALLLVVAQPWFVPRDERRAVEDEEYDSYENTVLFLVSAFQYIALAVVFARGAPYRRHLITNAFFVANLAVLLVLTLVAALAPLGPLQRWLGLVETPRRAPGRGWSPAFRGLLVGLAAANGMLCALAERAAERVRCPGRQPLHRRLTADLGGWPSARWSGAGGGKEWTRTRPEDEVAVEMEARGSSKR